MFSAPNSSSIMGSVPAAQRGAASGMRSTFQNTGTALSIGVFFSLMIAGLASTLPARCPAGLRQHGVPHAVAHTSPRCRRSRRCSRPCSASTRSRTCSRRRRARLAVARTAAAVLTGKEFFPQLIAAPFHDGLVVVFGVAAALAAIAGLASWQRGERQPAPTSLPKPDSEGARR